MAVGSGDKLGNDWSAIRGTTDKASQSQKWHQDPRRAARCECMPSQPGGRAQDYVLFFVSCVKILQVKYIGGAVLQE